MAKINLEIFLNSLTHPRHRELADCILNKETLKQMEDKGFVKEKIQEMSDKIHWAKMGYSKPCYGCSVIRKFIGLQKVYK